MTLRDGLKNSKGLGSALEVLTKAVGIKPCGRCKERRNKLDKKVPFVKHS